MTWEQKIYDAFGPEVTDRDIEAALAYYSEEELEDLLEQARQDIKSACERFLSARSADESA